MIPTLAQLGQRLWMPDSASTFGPSTDFLFYFIYWISAGAFVIILMLLTFFVIRFRHRPGQTRPQASPAHSTALELTWSFIPAIALVAMFYFGFRGFVDQATTPDYAYEIQVTGFKWGWQFAYPNGATSPDLHIPKDRPVKLILSSQDVIHSIFVPAFRMKKDVVPGRYNNVWVQATDLPPVRNDGERYFDLYCTEYCGTKHSLMRSKVFVHETGAFNAWLEEAANWVQHTPPVEAGAKLYQARGCAQCHSLEAGKTIVGPSFKNIYGYEHAMKDGSKVLVDENYVRQSILVPGAKVVAGFDNVMPSYQGRIKDIEVTAIVEWLKSLSDKGPKPLSEFPPSGAAPAGTPAAPAAAPAPAATPAAAPSTSTESH